MNRLRRFLNDYSDVVTEPLTWGDVTALIGALCGALGYLTGDWGHWSHIGMLAGGACLGQFIAFRSSRTHDKRMAEIYASAMRAFVADVNRLFTRRD